MRNQPPGGAMTFKIESVDVTKIGETMHFSDGPPFAWVEVTFVFSDASGTRSKPHVCATVPLNYTPGDSIADVRLRAVEAARELLVDAVTRLDADGSAKFLSASDERAARLATEEAEALRDLQVDPPDQRT